MLGFHLIMITVLKRFGHMSCVLVKVERVGENAIPAWPKTKTKTWAD